MVMKFESPQLSGVHHDIAPPPVIQKPRMSMADRFAAASATQKAEHGGDIIAINNTEADDRVAAEIRGINDKTDRAADAARIPESMPAASFEAAPEASAESAVETAKTVGEMSAEKKAEHQKAYQDAMWKKQARAQTDVMAAREALFRRAPQTSGIVPEREGRPQAETYSPPVKTGQRIFCPLINDFAYVLAVESGSKEVTLVRSLAEVESAQHIAQSNEKGLREAGNVQIPITFDQCRQFLQVTPDIQETDHLQNRYNAAA